MQNLAGYRLVRLLARGTRTEVWLGATEAGTTPVAIKLFHPATPRQRVDAEVEALGRASHRHLQRLIDVSLDPGGSTCIVLERLGPSLARVLAEREHLSAGEAVTVLAPLCDALTELHRVGVAHGALSAGAVLFDDDGAPILTSFGSTELVGEFPVPPRPASLTPAQEDAHPSLTADRESLARLAEHVLAATEPSAGSVLTWLRQGTPATRDFAGELAQRLHSLGVAAPVAMPGTPSTPRSLPLAVRPPKLTPQPECDDPMPARGDQPAASAVLNLMPPWLADRLAHRLAQRLEPLLSRLGAEWFPDGSPGGVSGRMRAALSAVRPRVWVVAGGGILAVLLAFALLGSAPPSGAEPHEPAPVGVATTPSPGAVNHDPVPADPVPADPVAAARVLVAHREQCFRDNSLLCLEESHQRASAAMEADRHAIRQNQQDAPVNSRTDWSRADLHLRDELGDGAVIDATVTPPHNGDEAHTLTATLLLVRTEEGWRIRDLIE